MELTQKTVKDRLICLRQLIEETPEKFEILKGALHEKGVECAIIIPLIETVLEFDTLYDVKYEHSSEKEYHQRFDFLLCDKFLIEAKPLDTNLDGHYKQIGKYLSKNENINYGLLTNGIVFQVWVQKAYIESVSKNKLDHSQSVIKVLEVSLSEDTVDLVLDTLTLFKKSIYENSFESIASIAGYYASGSKGKPRILHDKKETDKEIKDKIKDLVSIQKGVYYDDVKNKEISPGDKLQFKNDFVEITVEVTKTGTVILKKYSANIVDLIKAQEAGWKKLIYLITERWSKEDTEFIDPIEIIKLALDTQRLHGKEKYKFERI